MREVASDAPDAVAVHHEHGSAVAAAELRVFGGLGHYKIVERHTERLLHLRPVETQLGDAKVGHHAHHRHNGRGARQYQLVSLAPHLDAVTRQPDLLLRLAQRTVHIARVLVVQPAAWKGYLEAVAAQVPRASRIEQGNLVSKSKKED